MFSIKRIAIVQRPRCCCNSAAVSWLVEKAELCSAPVKRLAGKMVCEMICNELSPLLNPSQINSTIYEISCWTVRPGANESRAGGAASS